VAPAPSLPVALPVVDKVAPTFTKTTRKADPAGIYTYHNTDDGISLGMQLATNEKVTVALAVCSPRDQFSRKKAQKILRARLAKKRFTSTDPKRVVLTFPLGSYKGGKFKDEVFQPALEFVRDNAYLFLIREDDIGSQRKYLKKFVDEIIKIRIYDQAHLI